MSQQIQLQHLVQPQALPLLPKSSPHRNSLNSNTALHWPLPSAPSTNSTIRTPYLDPLPKPALRFPELSQLSIAGYAGFTALAALYVSHASANTSADTAILANKISISALIQAQVANQAQLTQVCLVNASSLNTPCETILASAPLLLPNLSAIASIGFSYTADNDVIETRFKLELMGFHIAFFSLLAISLVHITISLWKPVGDYLSERKHYRRWRKAVSRKKTSQAK